MQATRGRQVTDVNPGSYSTNLPGKASLQVQWRLGCLGAATAFSLDLRQLHGSLGRPQGGGVLGCRMGTSLVGHAVMLTPECLCVCP